MLPVPAGLSRLLDHDVPISIVSVVGPYHSGKSFLLNALMGGNLQVFQVGRRTKPETMGIWLCRSELKAKDGSEVWFMDSEGFFGPGVTETYDAKVFTVATLLGAHLVYNTVKIIDQQQVSLLEMLARRAQLFRTRSSAELFADDVPDFLRSQSFPPLTWVVEDFVQEISNHPRSGGSALDWLKSYLPSVNASGLPDEPILTKLYSDLRVHTLFLPAVEKSQLVDLSQVAWQQLTPTFRSEVEALRADILKELSARQIEGRPMTGRTLERALRFIVQALQRGMFHDLPSLWVTWTQQVAEMSLQDADTYFASLLTLIDGGADPVPVGNFNSEVEVAREKTLAFYKDLLRNFDVSLEFGELRSRMGNRFAHKLTLYHERIQRWVSEMIQQAKDDTARLLASVELPMDPSALSAKSETTLAAATKDFTSRISTFSAQQGWSPVKHGKQAYMPTFSTEPKTQLASDLRTLWGMKELENERANLQLFKGAVTAADETVDAELKASTNRLLGKATMTQFQKHVAQRCWEAFDERLVGYPWVAGSHHYKTHKALVQTETLESRLSRFSSVNEQRLTTHFRGVLDRLFNTYRVRKANMSLPVSEVDVETLHRGIANSMRDALKEDAKDVADTDVFSAVLRELDAVMEDGLTHVRQKNVELWKIYSDEATRCALRRNHALERECGLLCMFNKIPRVHKTTSRQHLLDCFGLSPSTTRMTPGMQLMVFENWYSRELARDASMVWNHFYIGSALLGGAILLCTGLMRPRAPPMPNTWQAAPRNSMGGAGMGRNMYSNY